MRDPSDFDEFYQANVAGLTRYAYGLTGDAGAAQDLAQDTFAKAWRHWSSVRDYERPQAWLRTVAARLAINRWRRLRGKTATLVGLAPSGAASPPPSEDVVVLVAALRQLPAAVRQAVVLHHMLDLTVTDIAAETGAPTGTVKARLTRGREQLAKILTDQSAPMSDREALDAS
jgi:RNA polymerase sigma-70 factor (ECF subfamily)